MSEVLQECEYKEGTADQRKDWRDLRDLRRIVEVDGGQGHVNGVDT